MHSAVLLLPVFVLYARSNKIHLELLREPLSETQISNQVTSEQVNDNSTSQVCVAMTITQCEIVDLDQDGTKDIEKRGMSALVSEAYLYGFDMSQLPILPDIKRTAKPLSFSINGGTLGGSPTGIVKQVHIEQVPVTDSIYGQVPKTKRVDEQHIAWMYPTSIPQISDTIASGGISSLKSFLSKESAFAAALSKEAASVSEEVAIASKAVSSASRDICKNDNYKGQALCSGASYTLQHNLLLHVSLLTAILSLSLAFIL